MFSNFLKFSYLKTDSKKKVKKLYSFPTIKKPNIKIKQLVYCEPFFTIRKNKPEHTKKGYRTFKTISHNIGIDRSDNFQQFSEKIVRNSILSNSDKNILASFLLTNKVIAKNKLQNFPTIKVSNSSSKFRGINTEIRQTRNHPLNNKFSFNDESNDCNFEQIYQMRKLSGAFSNSLLKSVFNQKINESVSQKVKNESKGCNTNIINPLYQGYKVVMKRYEYKN